MKSRPCEVPEEEGGTEEVTTLLLSTGRTENHWSESTIRVRARRSHQDGDTHAYTDDQVVLCIYNTISAKLSSFISHVCGNYDLIELHNVLSNYWLYLLIYFHTCKYTYILKRLALMCSENNLRKKGTPQKKIQMPSGNQHSATYWKVMARSNSGNLPTHHRQPGWELPDGRESASLPVTHVAAKSHSLTSFHQGQDKDGSRRQLENTVVDKPTPASFNIIFSCLEQEVGKCWYIGMLTTTRSMTAVCMGSLTPTEINGNIFGLQPMCQITPVAEREA